MTSSPFLITTVCTGNVCRSPFAEARLRSRFGGHDILVSSAGTDAVAGMRVPALAVAAAGALGEDVADHRARALTNHAVIEADLILGLSREHRRAAALLHPRANRYAFTLWEFARLSQTVEKTDLARLGEIDRSESAQRMRTLVPLLASRRGRLPLMSGRDALDIPDPIGRSRDVYEEVAASIADACEIISTFVSRALSE